MIEIGQTAPDFTLPRDGGGSITLSALRPAPVVLFTYGGDGTPTCTNEVMDFNGLQADFAKAGCVVLGLSKDSAAKHDKFIAKMGITLPLASDAGGQVMEEWGAFGEKLFFGKLVQGVLRSTFLIDAGGRVAKIWKVDRVKGHAAEVLAAVQAL
ncbi:MAG: peroxiredoxin [Cypionkella sp.]|uniref:peroxiredoxin n=1 Tax=Cypionkella sp. TaxID=2811411 RepID=UPI002ABAFB46|nr:peroxiredoxin [Cypionkella sp.]MDZ4311250.1 peroxiredoxin [Cypionkella sp.]MDZ4393071.1 peroxiredoxin [Cypionkella sp.]